MEEEPAVMPVDDSKAEDQLIKKTAESIRVDVFDLANEEERKDSAALHYKDPIKIKKQKEESLAVSNENELSHGSEEFNEIKNNQSELFDFMDNLRSYAKQIQAKIDKEDDPSTESTAQPQ